MVKDVASGMVIICAPVSIYTGALWLGVCFVILFGFCLTHHVWKSLQNCKKIRARIERIKKIRKERQNAATGDSTSDS